MDEQTSNAEIAQLRGLDRARRRERKRRREREMVVSGRSVFTLDRINAERARRAAAKLAEKPVPRQT